MIHDLFANMAILLSFLLIIGQIFKSKSFDSKQAPKTQGLLGLAFGTLGIVLMLFTIRMTDTVIIDLRNISIICGGIFGGPVAAMFTAVIIALFRLIYFGFNTASIVGHIVALILGVGIAYISTLKISRFYKFTYMFFFSLIIANAAFYYLIGDKSKLFETLSYYHPIYIFGTVLAYFTSEYIISANSSFKNMLYYRMTADNLLDMISTHEPGGKIKFVSPPVEPLFGFTQNEFIGTSAYEYIHPEDIDLVKNEFSNLIENKENYTQAFRMRHKNGSYIWVETSVKIIRNTDGSTRELICVTRDISIRKEIEKNLNMCNARFKAAFDNAAVAMCLAHINGSFFKTNQMFCDLVGYSEEELLNMNFIQITYTEDLEKDLSLMKRLLSRELPKIIFEKRYIHKNGEIIWGLLGVSIVHDNENKPLYLVGQIQDITSRKLAEEELQKAKHNAEKLASIDFLTATLNRRAFQDRFNDELNRAIREGLPISIILTDIDHFKKINDIYGHQVGDIALQGFSQCLSNACRSYDFIGRHGGEEFSICLPNTNLEQAVIIAERMRKSTENLAINSSNNEEKIKLAASFGVASLTPEEDESIHSLILKADMAMYKAKAKGRNRVCT